MLKKLLIAIIAVLATVPAMSAATTSIDKMIDEIKKIKDSDISFVESRDPKTNRVLRRTVMVGWNQNPIIKKLLKAADQDRNIATNSRRSGTNKVEIIVIVRDQHQNCIYNINYIPKDMSWSFTASCNYQSDRSDSGCGRFDDFEFFNSLSDLDNLKQLNELQFLSESDFELMNSDLSSSNKCNEGFQALTESDIEKMREDIRRDVDESLRRSGIKR